MFGLAERQVFDYISPMPKVNRILIVVKNGNLVAVQDADSLRDCLAKQGVEASCAHAGDADAVVRFGAAAHDGMVLILGGDGTMAGVIRLLIDRGLRHMPVLGVNYGRVGFLAEAPRGNHDELASMLARGTYTVHFRTALKWKVFRADKILACGAAVNDVTLARRTPLSRVCALAIGVDGTELGAFRADGVIVSSPAGSSGYTYSAGGSLIYPSLQAIAVTAVSPFLSHFPNMVLPPDKTVEFAVLPVSAETGLTVDGQTGFDLEPGDTVHVCGMSEAFSVIVPEGSSYFCRLRRCGFTFEPFECAR